MDSSTLQRLAADPAEFRKVLTIPAVHGPARFVEVMAPFQATDFAALDSALLALKAGSKPPTTRYWFERTKGASKDSDLAVSLLWLLAFAPRPLHCQVGAADQDQADEMRKAAKSILRLNAWLGNLLTIQALSIINPRTESRCEIVPADVAGSHGARPDVLVLNELSHVQKREFAENLLDNAAKVPQGLVCIATNAGFVPSWQWDLREMARQSARWCFSAYSQPAPWLDAAELAERKRSTTPSRYARLWQGVWCAGSGDALQSDDVDAAITRRGPWSKQKPGWVFIAGLDIGLAKDATALVVLGKSVGETRLIERDAGEVSVPRALQIARDLGMIPEPPPREEIERSVPGTGRLRLASVVLWKPGPGRRVDLGAVERSILRLHEHFGIEQLAFDPHQAEYLVDRLVDAGVPCERVPFTGSNLQNMATSLLDVFTARQIDLFPHEQLLADLRALRIEEKSYGLRLTSPRGPAGHGDCATGLALAIHASRSFSDPAGDLFVDHDLVY